METIASSIQSLQPSALIEVFELDMSVTTSGGKLYFHAGTNELSEPIIWQGVTYKPWPIAASGFDKNGQGKLPRPKLQVSNLDGIISAEVQSNEDLIGCKLIRRVTLARFLDAANFTEGNPTADANQHFADEMWYIDQKTFEDREIVEFELASAFDLMGVMLPNRQIVKNSCQWRYRSAECGYTGPYFDKNDAPTKLASADYCTKRLSSCRARINYFANGIIAFGGFPGANRA
ncbi:phage minor tail protein L [Enterobacter hormaechei]|uniref:phage minor tail protein L n=1 Tax=Enterobacter cloacae complex TaxID=354276 RepID=UPI0006DB1964|nr:phage minor tail protein L [Enterobacter hormaechei]HDS9658328.1 phage minor tail protein L [Klebsiella pneumoniae subsp. pneumoniae]HEO9915963.1 phage minor tail protein L [Enterobacter asburiae]EKV8997283.1 phage minor tail protein L [Enterobacter hormaechei]KPR16507.1 phage tail protein [Enterobacter hormaechei]CZV82056.1 phage minor tail protein L [Enterobacter hormaechei]